MFINFFDCVMILWHKIAKLSDKEKKCIALISALLPGNCMLMQILAFMNIAYSKQRHAFIVLVNQTLMEKKHLLLARTINFAFINI